MKDYITRYKYVKNNTSFRIATSEIQERYKKMQNFMLSEMSTGSNVFPEDVREIYLLKLDLWFYFLCIIERDWLNNPFEALDQNRLNEVLSVCSDISGKYNEVMHNNPENFNKSVLDPWSEVHYGLYEYLISKINKVSGMNMQDAYIYIGDNLIDVLKATLYELHEINILLNLYSERLAGPGEAVLLFSDICPSYFDETGKCLIGERYSVYKKYFDLNEIIVRDYSNTGMTSKCIESLSKYGKINFEKSLVHK